MLRSARRRARWWGDVIVLEGRGESAEAERLVRHQMARKPNDPDPYLALADVLNLRRDSNPGAAEQAVHAAELAWDDPSIVYMAAHRAVYGDLDAARRLVARVDELLREPGRGATFPFHNELLYVNGLIALRSGDPKQARAMLSLAYEADPTIVGLAYDLAFSFAQEDRDDEAAAVIADALTHDPENKRLRELQETVERRREWNERYGAAE